MSRALIAFMLTFGLATIFTATANDFECLVLNEEIDFEVQLVAENDHVNCFSIDEQYAGYAVSIITESEENIAHSLSVRGYNSSNDSPHHLASSTANADGVSFTDFFQPSGSSDFRVLAGDKVNVDLDLRITFLPFNGEAFVFLTISRVELTTGPLW